MARKSRKRKRRSEVLERLKFFHISCAQTRNARERQGTLCRTMVVVVIIIITIVISRPSMIQITRWPYGAWGEWMPSRSMHTILTWCGIQKSHPYPTHLGIHVLPLQHLHPHLPEPAAPHHASASSSFVGRYMITPGCVPTLAAGDDTVVICSTRRW
jgi:hypothetical protein